MSDIGYKVEELGRTLKAQFNMLATADLDDPAQELKLQALSEQSNNLQRELVEAFGLTVTTPSSEALAKIIARAEAEELPGVAYLKEALAQADAMIALLPQDACLSVEAVQDIARKALNLPRP